MSVLKNQSLWCRGWAVLLLVLIGQPSSLHAQSRQVPAPPQSRPIILHDATVHPVGAPVIERGYVIFAEGRITAIGSGPAPKSARGAPVNAEGLHVYPGLIACDTRLGLVETGAVDVTNDHNELGDITPEARAIVAVNPDSEHIPVTRANGILTAMTAPGGGTIAGQSAVIRLDGWTWEDLAINASAGLMIQWPRTDVVRSRWMNQGAGEQRKAIGERLTELEELFDEAERVLKACDADPTLRRDMRWEAMRAALAGDEPVFIRAASTSQIESAVAFCMRRNLRPIIVGGRDADRVLPLLLEHDVPVIVGGMHQIPAARHDAYDRAFVLPSRLHEAGVRFAIAAGGSGSAHVRNLNHQAATAAAYGLPKDAALHAVTLGAAEILGIGTTHGSLEVGKAATMIVTTGDPLEITTDVLLAFVDGRAIQLGNRQKALDKKYREKYRQLGFYEEVPPE